MVDFAIILIAAPLMLASIVSQKGAAPPIPGIHSPPSSRPAAATTPSINCSDVSTNIDSSCWDTLDMFEWMLNWNSTTTCESGEAWSTCFLRLAYQVSGNDCTKIGSLDCPEPEPGQVPYEAHAFYGVYNIWGMMMRSTLYISLKID